MQKRYHFARQRAQLIHLSKRLLALRAAGRCLGHDQLARFRRLAGQLAPRLGTTGLRRALGTGALLLGVAFGANAQQANFGAPRVTPFGIDGSDISSYAKPTFADFDGDGDLDLMYGLYLEEDDSYVTVFAFQENVGTAEAPSFGERQINPFGLTSITDAITTEFVDLDGDGDLDLLETGLNYGGPNYGDEGDPIILYRENTGTATAPNFAAPQINPLGLTTPGVTGNAVVLTFGDLDNDGDLDMLGFSYDADSYGDGARNYYYENTTVDGVPSFAAPVTEPFGISNNSINIAYQVPDILADLDDDGDLDLFGTDFSYEYDGENSTYLVASLFLENTGSATAPAFGAVESGAEFGVDTFNTDAYVVRSVLADIDGDGDLDLFVTSDEDGIVLYPNGTLTSVREQPVTVDLTLFPNPTPGLVDLTTDAELTGLELYDALGRRVQQYAGNVRRLDLTGLPAGNYTAKLLLPDGKFHATRVVKR